MPDNDERKARVLQYGQERYDYGFQIGLMYGFCAGLVLTVATLTMFRGLAH
jgi:hypothetical protein